MKVNELESRLQIDRANIRFYEKEGLLSPKRSANGYRKYEGEVSEEEPKKKSGWRKLWIVLGDIFFLFGAMIGPPVLAEIVFIKLFGAETVFIMTLDAYSFYALTVIAVFLLILYLYSDLVLFYLEAESEKRKKFPPKKVRRKMLGYGLAALLITFLITCTWFDMFTLEGAVKQRLIFRREYEWDDVQYYTLKRGMDGVLEYIVVMEDGTKLTCLGSSSSLGNFVPEKGIADEEAYCLYLSQMFADRGIELRVKDWDKLYEKLDYEYWKDVAGKIREIAE